MEASGYTCCYQIQYACFRKSQVYPSEFLGFRVPEPNTVLNRRDNTGPRRVMGPQRVLGPVFPVDLYQSVETHPGSSQAYKIKGTLMQT